LMVASNSMSYKFRQFLIDSCENIGIELALYLYGPRGEDGHYTLILRKKADYE